MDRILHRNHRKLVIEQNISVFLSISLSLIFLFHRSLPIQLQHRNCCNVANNVGQFFFFYFFFATHTRWSGVHFTEVGICRGNLFHITKKICTTGRVSRKEPPVVVGSLSTTEDTRGWSLAGRDITGSNGGSFSGNRGNHGDLATWQIELESSPFSRPWSVSFVSGGTTAVSN